jgi:DNA-binding XRE family transcriptional regulator
MSVKEQQRLERLEQENQRIREMLGAAPKESAEAAVDRLWRSYRDLLDKVSHLNEDCRREGGKFGLGLKSEDDEYELTPAEAQAEWERNKEEEAANAAKVAKAKRRKAKAAKAKANPGSEIEVETEAAETENRETENHKQRRQLREAMGLTPEQMADHFGISLEYYQSLEDEGADDWDMQVRLSKFFNCRQEVFMWR